jgi:hypothetical protein
LPPLARSARQRSRRRSTLALIGRRAAGAGSITTPSTPPHARRTGPAAPKAARDDYEAFVAAVRALVGGDPPSAELAELAAAAWGVVGAGSGLARGGLEAPEGLKLHRPGLLQVGRALGKGASGAPRLWVQPSCPAQCQLRPPG